MERTSSLRGFLNTFLFFVGDLVLSNLLVLAEVIHGLFLGFQGILTQISCHKVRKSVLALFSWVYDDDGSMCLKEIMNNVEQYDPFIIWNIRLSS